MSRVMVDATVFENLADAARRWGGRWAEYADNAIASAVPVSSVSDTGPMARSDGPSTSSDAASAVAEREGTNRVGWGTDRHKTLLVYAQGPKTDIEVAKIVCPDDNARRDSLRRRCSDLKRMGLIAPTGETRVSDAKGRLREVHEITVLGTLALGCLVEGKSWVAD